MLSKIQMGTFIIYECQTKRNTEINYLSNRIISNNNYVIIFYHIYCRYQHHWNVLNKSLCVCVCVRQQVQLHRHIFNKEKINWIYYWHICRSANQIPLTRIRLYENIYIKSTVESHSEHIVLDLWNQTPHAHAVAKKVGGHYAAFLQIMRRRLSKFVESFFFCWVVLWLFSVFVLCGICPGNKRKIVDNDYFNYSLGD